MTVSVVIPTYNRGAAIGATVESALSQDVSPEEVEIIIVDDGSTDDTLAFLQENYGHNPRVRLFSIPNGGVAKARNFGLEQARGEFIAYLDHDDLWQSQKLRLQREMLQNRAEVGVVYCLWQEIDKKGAPISGHKFHLHDPNWTLPQGRIFAALIRRNFIISMSVPLVRTALARQVGGFDPETVPCDDYDFWLKLSRITEFALVREVLVFYHRHENQQSRDELRMWQAGRRAQLKYWPSVLHRPRVLWFLVASGYFLKTTTPFYVRARDAIAGAHWREVRRQIVACSVRYPFALLTPQWLYILKRLVTKNAKPF